MEPTSPRPLQLTQLHCFNLAFILFLNLFSLISWQGLVCDIRVRGFTDRSAARGIKVLMRDTAETLMLDKDTSANGLDNIKVQYFRELTNSFMKCYFTYAAFYVVGFSLFCIFFMSCVHSVPPGCCRTLLLWGAIKFEVC